METFLAWLVIYAFYHVVFCAVMDLEGVEVVFGPAIFLLAALVAGAMASVLVWAITTVL